MQKRIYLDNNATTPLDPHVFAKFQEVLQNTWANPSSIHLPGQQAKALLLESRERIASHFDVRPQEVVFTSSGTEALNLCIRGVFGFVPKGHIITTRLEHSAVYETVQLLEKAGMDVSYLEAGLNGAASPAQVLEAIRPNTKLISLMAANNETGVKTDIEEIAKIAMCENISFIVDGVALLGKEPFQLHQGVSAICFSGHKFHAPKGIGFAIIRKSLKLSPWITGGPQEGGRRAGTENLAACIALATALDIAHEQIHDSRKKMVHLRDFFEKELLSACPDSKINGLGPRICNTSNICFEKVEGEALLMYLDLHGIAASHGSACSSGALEPSRVLLHMGISLKDAASSIRFSLSRFTTQEEIEKSLDIIIQGVKKLRQFHRKT